MAQERQPGRPGERPKFIAGNWKMYKPLAEARSLASEIAARAPATDDLRVALFPAAIALAAVVEAVREAPRIIVGAQNMHFEKEGAFTGEISAAMIESAGGRAVILGHSERRHVFGETDDLVGRKVTAAIAQGLLPVLCVGETLEERELGKTKDVVARQLATGLSGVRDSASIRRIIVAYEPVWAIGTGKTATPEQGQEVQHYLRAELKDLLSSLASPAEAEAGADECLILYGGSVKPENAASLLREPDIDGFLVGGASLKADSFLKICEAGL